MATMKNKTLFPIILLGLISGLATGCTTQDKRIRLSFGSYVATSMTGISYEEFVAKMFEDETGKKGKVIRKERFEGAMQRSFYVGENLTEEDIKAAFNHGVLHLDVPKKEKAKLPEKKTIMIEG